MTSPDSTLSQEARDKFDTGPLSWVMAEIREALNRSKAALREAVAQDADAQATSMRHAKSYLHQAHGALQIVDVDGVAIITETVEELLDRIDGGQLALSDNLVHAIETAYQALVEYLEELLAGAPHQPVRLFPYYRALLEARGAERIHPADLFFPNLAIRPKLPPPEQRKPSTAADYQVLRQRFEKVLLPFLRSSDTSSELANAASMLEIIADVEARQTGSHARSFWWVMHGLAEAVAGGQIENEIYVKQLFARINLQLRRLCQGSSSIAERLLRDALFFIAKAVDPSPRAQQIRAAYQLDGLVPADYDRKRYGQVDTDAVAAARERLAQAKSMWNRVAGGDAAMAESFEHEMHVLADVGGKLNSPPLGKLLRELKGIARHAARAKPGDMLGLEMATSLLFVENALNHISQLPENFGERADAMTARLLTVVSGDMPSESAQWLDDMTREAQQRQTMSALAGEMQASLRQVEKLLDEYFRDAAQRDPLNQLDSMLHQIEGALAVLDQGDAVQTIRHTRAAVQRFVDAEEEVPAQESFQQVARNVGALSFFLEALQLDADEAKRRFSFDEARGVFEARIVERHAAAAGSPVEIEVNVPPLPQSGAAAIDLDEASEPTVEDELAYHQRKSADLALSLTAQPDNPALQGQLKESLEQIRLDATLIDNPEVNDRAQAGIDILERPDFSASTQALAEIITATVPEHAAADPLPPVVAPASDEAIDAELLEIFLSEAVEVLGAVRQTLPESRSAPHSQEHLTTLRRAFHTLKGSGRMVGLVAFGEAAWSIEQVLNLRLSESRGGDTELYALLEKAAEVLGAWVQDLQLTGMSARTPDALVAAAARVKAGQRFSYDDQPAAAQGSELPPTPEAGFPEAVAAIDELLEPALPTNETVIAAAGVAEPDMQGAALLPQAEEVELSDAELAMFGDEAQLTQPTQPTEKAEKTADIASREQASAARDAEIIGFPVPPVRDSASEVAHDDNVKRIGDLEISVPLHNIYLAETDELVRLLAQDFAEWRHEPERQVNVHAVHAAHSLAGSSATVGFTGLQDVAHALELVLQALARSPVRLTPHDFDTLEQSVERLKLMLQKFALGEMPPYRPEYTRLLASVRQDIEQRARQLGDRALWSVEDFPPLENEATTDDLVAEAADTVTAEAAIDFAPAADDGLAAVKPANADSSYDTEDDSEDNAGAVPGTALSDELDVDLLPVFLEEGRDMLPQLGAALRSWQDKPTDLALPQSVLRLLHTLKGSARMAGAMRLGQHLHDLETRIENLMRLGTPAVLALDDLLIRYDQALHMFDRLQDPEAERQEPEATPDEDGDDRGDGRGADNAAAAGDDTAPVVLAPLMPVPRAAPLIAPAERQIAAPAAPAPLVRVRADILDRLVNQAGEVSISRSKLETEVGTLRQSLTELTENVVRLREQLREIEMQAESQITSRMANSSDREFDPLEFDRFTRLQELTRMMAETVNDVGSVHHNLSRTLDDAAVDLTSQARLTRDLQQDLMRVRMVQFGSIAERLFRVTRQAAKEVDKRVNLDIRGGSVEIDRSVLEKMAGPFEHLLRNAIVHGIEGRERRRAAGKSEVGELLVEVRQEGNEVVIRFSDDGQGLNIDRIRSKAASLGLLADQRDLPDEEVADLIFHPGFSTAEEITELAGRGIGMDVVRSEAATLGGRVATTSQAGSGTQFTIHLPLTLAVTQVVLLSSGGKTYAVPSVLVEQVQQLKAHALTAAYNDGSVVWQGQRVAMHYLPALLGDAAATPVAQQYTPLVILKSGSERVAIHVDEIIGNREVVVKNIGPQLARMIGIAGATVLGSGDIVLILNPVPLAQQASQENMRAPRILPSDAPDSMGAVADLLPQQPAVPQSEPVQGLRTQSIVMVVDDSLTVRRVTQRLLAREGYQVVLAKDGVDALEQLQSVTPDVMLVDIEMPRMDGFDLTRNVRDDTRTKTIPIIMITSRTAAKHRNYALELGVNEYLGKPYQEEQLLELIAGFINREAPIA